MEKFFDSLELMENAIPDYGYAGGKDADETDRKVRDYLSSEVKEMKDTMFHVVQVSYELQKDELSKASESAWDEVSSLLSRVQSSRLCACAKKHGGCEVCSDKAERKFDALVRKDRELMEAVKVMKASVRDLYKALLQRGEEKYFIRNLDKIKDSAELVIGILLAREKLIRGD